MLKICLDTTAVGSTEHAPEKERNQIFAHAGKRVSQQLSGNINQKLNNEQHCDESCFKHGIHQKFHLKLSFMKWICLEMLLLKRSARNSVKLLF